MAHDTQAVRAVMELIEVRRLELPQPVRNHPAPTMHARREPGATMNAQAVGEQVSTAKRDRVRDHLIDLQSHGRVVGGYDSAGAHADNGVQRHSMPDQLFQDSGVGGAAQASGTQHDADSHGFRFAGTRIPRPSLHSSIGCARSDECNLG